LVLAGAKKALKGSAVAGDAEGASSSSALTPQEKAEK
jgi:hypothetical protein